MTLSNPTLGHAGVSRLLAEHLKMNVPDMMVRLRAARGKDQALWPDPVTWIAHERFPGDNGANINTTPIVMVTTDGATRFRQAGEDGVDVTTLTAYGPVVTIDYLARIIVCVHTPSPGVDGSENSDDYQRVYDLRSDILLACRQVLLLRPAIAPNVKTSQAGMSESLIVPEQPSTSRTYLEGMLICQVSAVESVPLPLPANPFFTGVITDVRSEVSTLSFPVA